MDHVTTLLIPTHNRPIQLNRLLKFIENRLDGIRVIVSDSSDDEGLSLNKRNIAESAAAGSIIHLVRSGKTFPEKLVEGLGRVETETVCFCGDDDLVVPEQIVRCDRFLRGNPDFSHARGTILTFLDTPQVDLRTSMDLYPQWQIDMEHPIDRLTYHLRHYKSNFYSVRRTQNAKGNLERIYGMDLGRGLHERLVPVLDLLDGKGAVFPDLFMFRQKGQSLTDERGRNTTADKRLRGRSYAEELTRNSETYSRFIETEVRDRLGSRDSYRQAQLKRIIKSDLRTYFLDKMRPRRLSLNRIRRFLSARLNRARPLFLETEANQRELEKMLHHVLACRIAA